MPRREHSAYEAYDRDEIESDRSRMTTRAKSHPKYVHGKVGAAMLLHRIAYVSMRWYDLAWNQAIRLKHPKMMAYTVCGTQFFLEAGRSGVCESPKPDAVLCGMCTGTGRIWPRGEKNPKVTKRQAKDRLGCIVTGTET